MSASFIMEGRRVTQGMRISSKEKPLIMGERFRTPLYFINAKLYITHFNLTFKIISILGLVFQLYMVPICTAGKE